jgi:hypothetical protein
VPEDYERDKEDFSRLAGFEEVLGLCAGDAWMKNWVDKN